MATPNKFSNPDVSVCDCPRQYASCLVIGPLQGIFCLPFVCCARAHKDHEKQKQQQGDIRGHEKGKGSDGAVEDQPSKQPDMTMLPDASKPKDQWPVEWRDHSAVSATVQPDSAEYKTVKDKLADGVLKVATVA